MAGLAAQAAGDSIKIKDKRSILARLRELDPTNQDLVVSQVFYAAMDEAWAEALELARGYLARPGRASAGRLAMGLLEPELALLLGRQAEALARLEAYLGRTREPWHHDLAETLLGRRTEEALRQKAGEGPENLLTGHLALGLWSEGQGGKDKAIRHYKEALESFLDSWLEYDLVKERLKKLRQPS
jgi:tetratricopeptide (TPR) repeat protein